MITYLLIFVFFIILGLIVFYLISTFIMPKRLDEIAGMIESGQTKLAIKKLNELIEKDDRNPNAHYLMAEAYFKEGNMQYAIVEYRQVLKLGRFDEMISEKQVRSKLANLFKERKNLEEAKKEYLILTKIDPANYENYYELGLIFFNSNQQDKAVGFFKKSIASNGKHDMSYYYLGQIYYKSASYSEAKQAFMNALKLDPNNYKAHYYMGLVLRQQGDFEWAIKEFETSQKSDELKVKSFLAKGSCYMERGQHPKAAAEFERGLKFAREGSDAALNLRYFLADCQEKMRDVHAAIHNWEKIVEVNKNFRDVQEKLKQFSEFRQDDRIKDFLIAGLSQFEHLSRKMIMAMGFTITDVDIISDTEIEMIATEMEGKWRNARQSNRIIRIVRTTESIPESLLRKLYENMKPRNATRIMVITTGDYASKALDFAQTRPIETLGKTELIEMLKKV
jgi:tetratricopeptide (TPR) repeat protein